MAIYFPELFCKKGQLLVLKQDITYDGNKKLLKGEKCIVEDIIEYGFDIVFDNGAEFRFLNREMPEFFEKVDSKPAILISYRNSPVLNGIMVRIANKLAGGNLPSDEGIEEDLIREQNILTFIKDFTVRSANKTFYSGEKFFYKEDKKDREGHENKVYYNLYDVVSYRLVLRMSGKEVNQFCQLERHYEEALV